MMPGGRHPGFIESFGYAFQGIRAAFKRERNIKVMLAIGVLAVVLGVVLRVDAVGWAVIVVCIGAVLCAELLNSGIEAVVDLVSPQYHPLAKLAKDYACAGVYLLCMCSAVAGCIIYIRAIVALLAG
ncbi:MAG: diacylglycerol kinase family protein [Coriobacteriales bacterium]|jgi:undecaprenol kinase